MAYGNVKIHEIVEKAVGHKWSITARISIGTRRPPVVFDSLWIDGCSQPFSVPKTLRPLDIKALDRENKLYDLPTQVSIDAAIELLSTLEGGPAAPAAAISWAAVESLLAGPSGSGNKSDAARKLADIIACSFPRAELTDLAFKHMANSTDALSVRLKGLATNGERASCLVQHLKSGAAITVPTRSDALALLRMKAFLQDPSKTVKRIREYTQQAIHRLYRQRNLILHWGRTSSVALLPALRTVTPLLGAAFDRICHAWFTNGESPLHLAAKARIGLSLLSDSNPPGPARLLD